MIGAARFAAYQVLSAVSSGRGLPEALATARDTLKDDRDQALAADISIGVQRWRGEIDHLIAVFSRRSIDRLDPEVLEVLRLGAYQLLHLTRVPAAAAVDDAVKLAGRIGKRSAGALVNAVLRALSRNRGRLPLPRRPTDGANREMVLDYLSITLSHPRWLVARWLRRHGFDATEKWLLFNNTPAAVALRANRLRYTVEEVQEFLRRDGILAVRSRFAPDGLVVEHQKSDDREERGREASGRRAQVLRGEGLDRGWFVVQDEASQLVSLLAGSAPGPRVLDACASPGGKTAALAAAMNGRGILVACDVRSRRVDLLRRTIGRTGAPNVRVVQADLLRPLPFSQPFECVLVDAPCSGLGTLRRDPDIKWRRKEDDLKVLATSQLEMLNHAGAVVADRGRLIYATCSSEPEENESVVAAFLDRCPAFVAADLRTADLGLPRQVIDEHGHLRTYPHIHSLEAFFGAALERRGAR